MNHQQALYQQITNLLIQMELLSEAKTAAMDASPGHGKPGAVILRHNGPAMHDQWRQRFTDALGDQELLERLLKAGQAALALRKHGPPKIHDQGESENFILASYEGVDCETVAAIESERGAFCHPEYVRWLRRRNDFNDLGFPRRPSERRVRLVTRLYEETGSQAKVALAIGVSQQTVSRLLREGKMAA